MLKRWLWRYVLGSRVSFFSGDLSSQFDAVPGAIGLSSPGPRVCRCRSVAVDHRSVVVTREHGKNAKLIKALLPHNVGCFELPLIEHTPGPDVERLPSALTEKAFQWVVVTSPEAAAVFIDGWRNADFPKVKVAVVGEGTREAFNCIGEGKDRLEIGFIASQANAKVLAKELPNLDSKLEVLYPASLKASNELANGLTERGFTVYRLNTYSTESVQNLEEEQVAIAVQAPVVTFASPTAVKAWVELVSKAHNWNGAAACIGSTSAAAARKAGMERIFYAKNPGIEGWVESILEALGSVTL